MKKFRRTSLIKRLVKFIKRKTTGGKKDEKNHFRSNDDCNTTLGI